MNTERAQEVDPSVRPWSWLIIALLLILSVWGLSALLGPRRAPAIDGGVVPVGTLSSPERSPTAPAAETPSPGARHRDQHREGPGSDAAQDEALRMRSRLMA